MTQVGLPTADPGLGNGVTVTWCIGHLLETAPPDAYDAKYKRWVLAPSTAAMSLAWEGFSQRYSRMVITSDRVDAVQDAQ